MLQVPVAGLCENLKLCVPIIGTFAVASVRSDGRAEKLQCDLDWECWRRRQFASLRMGMVQSAGSQRCDVGTPENGVV